MNSYRIEIRYAVLINLLMLLWLALEFMIGLHDVYIAYHPYVTLLALLIPIVCSRMAIKDKTEDLNGKISFKQAFITGAIIAVLAAILSTPTQLVFHKLINPDFFDNMIAYSVKRAELNNLNITEAKVQAEQYFNLTSYLIQSFVGTLVVGFVLAVFMAWRTRTVK